MQESADRLAMATIVVETALHAHSLSPEHWWLIAWVVFLGSFVLLAQLAPVVLFPIFYKFEPLENEELKRRLIVLSERPGTRVRGVYKWHLSEKSKKANAALTGLGATRASFLPTLAGQLFRRRNRSRARARTRHHVHRQF